MNGRVGPNIHRDAWPTPTVLAGHLAAGLSWVQVHTPPPVVLGDHRSALRHARGVRDGLADSGLRPGPARPDDLSAGTPDADRAFEGLLRLRRRRAPRSSPTTA